MCRPSLLSRSWADTLAAYLAYDLLMAPALASRNAEIDALLDARDATPENVARWHNFVLDARVCLWGRG